MEPVLELFGPGPKRVSDVVTLLLADQRRQRLSMRADHSVEDVEALVRWQHPERGLLGPDAFLGVAERANLLLPLTTAVAMQAFAQASAWRAKGLNMSVALNIAPQLLTNLNLPDEIAALAQDHDIPTQQVMLDIWRDIRRLRDPSKYEGWSYRLLVRVCYAEAKRRPRWQSAGDIRADDEPRASDAYPGVADRDQLERGFQQLSMDHRVVLTLRFLVGMTPDEVAETLDLPDSTVYSRLQAALKAMRAALDADGRSVAHSLKRQEAMR